MTTLHLSSPVDEDEARMRRALDVGSHDGRGRQDHGHGPRPVRQFAQDGDVPVVRLAGRKDPLAQAASTRLEETMQAERAAREQAEALLKQANATIQALQTKIAHAEIAQAEIMATQNRSFEVRLGELQAELAAAQTAPVHEPKRAKQSVSVSVSSDAEPEPVQWWVPGWREGLGQAR